MISKHKVLSIANVVSSLAWYDYDLVAYQKERGVTDLEQIFEDRNQHLQEHGGIDLNAVHLKPKKIKDAQPDWQQTVKGKKNQEYYDKLQELETEQLLKEQRTREKNHQYAIAGDTVGKSSLAKGMASQYESQMLVADEIIFQTKFYSISILAKRRMKSVRRLRQSKRFEKSQIHLSQLFMEKRSTSPNKSRFRKK